MEVIIDILIFYFLMSKRTGSCAFISNSFW